MAKASKDKIIPLSQWSQHRKDYSENFVKNLVRHAEKKGFDALFRMGRLIYINERLFDKWVQAHPNYCRGSVHNFKKLPSNDECFSLQDKVRYAKLNAVLYEFLLAISKIYDGSDE